MKEYRKQEGLNGNFQNFEENISVSLWHDDEMDSYDVIVSRKSINSKMREEIMA